MSKASVAQEPSMDEILASIRRIIETGEDRGQGSPSGIQGGVARARSLEAVSGTVVPSVVASYSPNAPVASGSGQTFERADPVASVQMTAPSTPAYETSGYDISYVAAPGGPQDTDEDHLTAQLETELAATWGEPETDHNSASVQAETSPESMAFRGADRGEEDEVSELNASATDIPPEQARRPETIMSEPVRQEPIDERNAFEPANSDRRIPEPSVRGYDAYEAAANPLTSVATGQMVAASFEELAQAIRNGELKSLEAMAQDMLKPMLSEWLDDNLPRMVERLVREEIDRMSRGGSRR